MFKKFQCYLSSLPPSSTRHSFIRSAPPRTRVLSWSSVKSPRDSVRKSTNPAMSRRRKLLSESPWSRRQCSRSAVMATP